MIAYFILSIKATTKPKVLHELSAHQVKRHTPVILQGKSEGEKYQPYKTKPDFCLLKSCKIIQ